MPRVDNSDTATNGGKGSVQKGIQFQNMVAGLYELLGAHVIQNIEVCQKKVDLLATFSLPGSTKGHRVLVECKDEKEARAQNQIVMEFFGLLTTARKVNEADSAAIITRIPWSDQSKGFARDSGIELLTYDEKFAQLIDFTQYLSQLVDRFEKGSYERHNEPPLAAYYTDLYAEQSATKMKDNLDALVHKWLRCSDTHQQLAILGEYGTGKTAYCEKLAHDLASSFLAKPGSERIPILLNLRDFVKTLRLESLFTSFLDEQCGVSNPRFKLFKAMNDAGLLLIILDGFDEMSTKVDADTLELNLQEIDKLAASPRSKVIITSRIEYFVSEAEQIRSLSPKVTFLPTRLTEYQSLIILPWRNGQIRQFLEKRVPLIPEAEKDWTHYYEIISNMPGFADLSSRPVLLDMITKTLPELIANQKPINRPNLYETYLKSELKRQKITKKRTLLLDKDTRFSLLEILASSLYIGKFSKMSFQDAQGIVRGQISLPKNELEAYTRDFLTCSFLVREGDEYRFSHRSIMEYLVAKVLFREITQNTQDIFVRKSIDRLVMGFLMELDPNTSRLFKILESERMIHEKEPRRLSGNLVTLLCAINPKSLAKQDLSGLVLRDARLSNADLRGTNLTGTSMINVDLVGARFLKEDLSPAKLQDVVIHIMCLLRKTERFSTGGAALIDNLFTSLLTKPDETQETNVKLIRDYMTNIPNEFSDILLDQIVKIHNFHGLQPVRLIPSSAYSLLLVGFYHNDLKRLVQMIPENIKRNLLVKIDI